MSSPDPAPPRVLAPSAPLLLIGWDPPDGPLEARLERFVVDWRRLPDDLRPYLAMATGDASYEELAAYAAVSEREGIPFIAQVRTWFPSWLPQWRTHVLPLDEAEELLRRFPNLLGLQVVELNCFGFSREERRYVTALLQLVARHGRFLSWQEANDGCNVWLEAGLDTDFYAAMCRAAPYLLPQWEMNVPKSMYLCHDSCCGLWLAGAADHWGVEPQSWYWLECGFTELSRPGENHDRGYREGDRLRCPPTFWAQQLLLGASSGAEVYAFEPSIDAVFTPAHDGLSPVWHDVLAPLLRFLLAHRLIPNRRQVAAKVQVAYHADFATGAESERSDVDYYRGRAVDSFRHGRSGSRGRGTGTLYQGTYGIRHEWECIPNTGQYYWIPVLPRETSTHVLASFPQVIEPNTFAGESEVRRFFDGRYQGDGRGDAWIVRVGRAIFVTQTHENYDVEESFAVPLETPGLVELRGRVGPHQIVVAADGPVELHVHINGRRERVTEMSILTDGGRPEVDASPAEALRQVRWETEQQRLHLDVQLGRGVEITVRTGNG